MITDDQGKLQTSYDYDAFGNALNTAQPNSKINHRYVGEYLDEDSGFYHLRARDYDPKIGRFISRDTINGLITNPITLNNYVYPGSNPIDNTDSAGEMFSIAGIIDIGLSMNFQGMIRVGNVQGAKIVMKQLLFGRPPENLGLVGEIVLDYMVKSVIGQIGIDFSNKGVVGTAAHQDLKKRIADISKDLNNFHISKDIIVHHNHLLMTMVNIWAKEDEVL
ncbi:RHS repeat domain-containing protein [Snodgrassella communis]|uniref:RHS repeat domain-containing protein n=1 Tax=Snodgrassella communis TaxID=2946699 RepID=UPI001EF57B0A|nr:RHS repeat-associated core domain-containing protein [Snodgrassella communis]